MSSGHSILVLYSKPILACPFLWVLVLMSHGLPWKFWHPYQFTEVRSLLQVSTSHPRRALKLFPRAFEKPLNLIWRESPPVLTKSPSCSFIFCFSRSSFLLGFTPRQAFSVHTSVCQSAPAAPLEYNHSPHLEVLVFSSWATLRFDSFRFDFVWWSVGEMGENPEGEKHYLRRNLPSVHWKQGPLPSSKKYRQLLKSQRVQWNWRLEGSWV